MEKCFLYLRVSGLGQVDGYGFDRQRKACEAFCKQAKLQVEGIYREEGITGTADHEDRPAFQAMLADILANGCRTVVVESLDRLARELRIQESLLIYLAAKGITLYSARTGENITEAVSADPLRKALVQIQGVFAELEKSQLVRRLEKGRAAKERKTGKCAGRKYYGEADKDEAKVVRRIRRMRAKGPKGAPGLTLAAIADKLNAEGIPTRLGKTWTPTQVHNVLKRRA
ncbi:MAG: recombinase family protein [Proteobacteria bacterium]|nr:recombinase family protein [Pseudomonadota bacterium]MBU4385341.1 recombinase family protein [Pseudomonadota bacterium]MCG2764529.1 recombinase family protein [Desulfarculaceae bacterium]